MVVKDNGIVTVFGITSYLKAVYIYENAKIKPKALHTINKTTKAAMKHW